MKFTFAASVPTALAIRPARIWSVLAIDSPPGYRARIRLQLGDEIASRLDRRLGRDDEDLVFAHQVCQGSDVVEGHRRLVGDDGALQALTGDLDRVTFALLCGDELGKPDRSTGTSDVLHLNTDAKPAAEERFAWRAPSDPNRRRDWLEAQVQFLISAEAVAVDRTRDPNAATAAGRMRERLGCDSMGFLAFLKIIG